MGRANGRGWRLLRPKFIAGGRRSERKAAVELNEPADGMYTKKKCARDKRAKICVVFSFTRERARRHACDDRRVLLINVFLAIGFATLSRGGNNKNSSHKLNLYGRQNTSNSQQQLFSADLIDECAVDTSEEHARRKAIYSTSLAARFLESDGKTSNNRARSPPEKMLLNNK